MDWFANTFPDPVTAGGTLTITLTGATPGVLHKVRIRDGEGLDETVEVQTDGEGSGAIEWTVPEGTGWTLFLDCPGSDTHAIVVE